MKTKFHFGHSSSIILILVLIFQFKALYISTAKQLNKFTSTRCRPVSICLFHSLIHVNNETIKQINFIEGVVLSHKNLIHQVTTLLEAWKWTDKDTVLHTLPLHHVHGIVNALLSPQYVGAKCVMLPKFDANTAWALLLGINTDPEMRRISVYTAVPTIYAKLIEEYDKVFSKDEKMVEYILSTLKTKVRLMMSGSAPLPVGVHKRWLEISGHKLLERFGMTETGMILSNVYESEREPGYVGLPLNGIGVRLGETTPDKRDYLTLMESVNINGEIKTVIKESTTEDPVGEVLVKGDGVFKEYYNKAEETLRSFTSDGWFKTGDVAQYSRNKKLFKLLGRISGDIIKSSGHKVSTLEVESCLLEHPDVADCSVVGVADELYGQRIVAVVVLKQNVKELSLDDLKAFAKSRMPPYSVPKDMKIVVEIPKNVLGKVNKRELVKVLDVEWWKETSPVVRDITNDKSDDICNVNAYWVSLMDFVV